MNIRTHRFCFRDKRPLNVAMLRLNNYQLFNHVAKRDEHHWEHTSSKESEQSEQKPQQSIPGTLTQSRGVRGFARSFNENRAERRSPSTAHQHQPPIHSTGKLRINYYLIRLILHYNVGAEIFMAHVTRAFRF